MRFARAPRLVLLGLLAWSAVRILEAQGPAPAIDKGPLEPGQSRSAAIGGGQSHSYEISLKEGEFVLVVVEQRGVDVAVTLTGTDGKALAEMDSPNVSFGPEPLCWIAAAAGRYRLAVSPSEPGAKPAPYDVVVRDLRPATDRDRRRLAAQTSAVAAARRSEAGSGEALREAARLYEESAKVYREIDEPAGEARALFALAYVRSRLGDTRGNLEAMLRTVGLQEKIHDPGFEGSALTWTGIAYQDQGDREKAITYFSRAAQIQKGLGDAMAEAVTLGALGQAQGFLGDYAAALASHRRSEAILLSFGDRRNAAIAQNNIALIFGDLGDSNAALDGFGRALAVFRDVGDKQNEAITLNNMAFVHQEREEWEKALALHELALPIRRAIGDQRGEAYTLRNLGQTQAKLGRLAAARDSLASAVRIQKAVGDRFAEARTDYVLGEVELDARRLEAALAGFESALVIRKEIRDRWGEAEALAGVAMVLREQGDLAAARSRCEAALAVVETLRSGITAPDQRSTFLGKVRKFYELEIDLLMRLHERAPEQRLDLLALETSERARARSLLDLLAESRAKVRQGVDTQLLERDRALRARLGTQLDAQRRLLGRKHSEEEAAAVSREVEDIGRELEQVESHIRTASPRYAALTQPRPLAARELRSLLDPETVLLEYSLGEDRSFVWRIDRDTVKSFAIGKRSEIESAARAVYGMVSEAPGRRHSGPAGQDPIALLSRLVLSPVGALPARRVVVVADGALHFLPFAALHETGSREPLAARHEVVNLPSGSTLAILRSGPSKSEAPGRTLAVFADPVFERTDPRIRTGRESGPGPADSPQGPAAPLERSARDLGLTGPGGIPRLPFTRQEARAILDLVPAAERREALDFAATRDAVTSGGLEGARYLHLATHGFVDSVHPEFSGLVLALVDLQGRDVAGFLAATDIFNLKLSAEVVVLSACRTALGKEIRGEGLVGLTRAFMYAGAPRVVASLWRVDDAATAELMKRFYEGMLGPKKLKPAAALREAQLAMSRQKRWHDPYYWAAFVLQGEWN